MVSLGLLCLIALGQAQTPAPEVRRTTVTGTVEQIADFKSAVLGNQRDILVWLPPQYAKEPNRRFPFLYANDGQNLFDGATSYLANREWRLDETADFLIRARQMEPIIIVGIPNAGMERANEYLPTRFTVGREPGTSMAGTRRSTDGSCSRS